MINTRKANPKDIPGFLALQARNLYTNLTEEERQKGFVTTPFTIPQLEAIIELEGLFVATNEREDIIAYLFAGDWDYFRQWAIMEWMIARFPKCSFQGQAITTDNTFQYGPVCIDIAYRGQGILSALFEEMRVAFVQKFPTAITFINQVNIISTKAHTKIGWEIIDRFSFNENQYFGLAIDMKKKGRG